MPVLYLIQTSVAVCNKQSCMCSEDGEARERDEIRHDRRKERQHDRNLSRAAPDKR